MTTFLRALLAMMALLTMTPLHATVRDGGEYYIVSDYYQMALGVGDDVSKPRLSDATASNTPAMFVIVAETSDTNGWWLLRNKATGRYLKASTQDSWSVSWNDGRGTGNEFLWQLDVRLGGRITSKKSTDKRLGCDWTEQESVPVYYDKLASSRARWNVFPAVAEGYEASLLQAETEVFTNEQGRQEKDYWQVASEVTIDDDIDVHLHGDVPVATTGLLNITNEKAWIIFERVRPSKVIANYLRYIRLNGRKVTNGTNVRVAIWLDGAAVIPWKSGETVLTGYSEVNGGGKEVKRATETRRRWASTATPSAVLSCVAATWRPWLRARTAAATAVCMWLTTATSSSMHYPNSWTAASHRSTSARGNMSARKAGVQRRRLKTFTNRWTV